jgi:hypothetical protein
MEVNEMMRPRISFVIIFVILMAFSMVGCEKDIPVIEPLDEVLELDDEEIAEEVEEFLDYESESTNPFGVDNIAESSKNKSWYVVQFLETDVWFEVSGVERIAISYSEFEEFTGYYYELIQESGKSIYIKRGNREIPYLELVDTNIGWDPIKVIDVDSESEIEVIPDYEVDNQFWYLYNEREDPYSTISISIRRDSDEVVEYKHRQNSSEYRITRIFDIEEFSLSPMTAYDRLSQRETSSQDTREWYPIYLKDMDGLSFEISGVREVYLQFIEIKKILDNGYTNVVEYQFLRDPGEPVYIRGSDSNIRLKHSRYSGTTLGNLEEEVIATVELTKDSVLELSIDSNTDAWVFYEEFSGDGNGEVARLLSRNGVHYTKNRESLIEGFIWESGKIVSIDYFSREFQSILMELEGNYIPDDMVIKPMSTG